MYLLILQDSETGRQITWRPQNDEQQIAIANVLIALDCPSDAVEPVLLRPMEAAS